MPGDGWSESEANFTRSNIPADESSSSHRRPFHDINDGNSVDSLAYREGSVDLMLKARARSSWDQIPKQMYLWSRFKIQKKIQTYCRANLEFTPTSPQIVSRFWAKIKPTWKRRKTPNKIFIFMRNFNFNFSTDLNKIRFHTATRQKNFRTYQKN